jgi:hypothetical protein
MPVQETADAIADLRRLEIPAGTVIVNATQPELLPAGKVSQNEVRRGLVAAGLPAGRDTVSGLMSEVRAHLARREVEATLRADLEALGRPMVELPVLAAGVDLAGLYQLAGILLGRT